MIESVSEMKQSIPNTMCCALLQIPFVKKSPCHTPTIIRTLHSLFMKLLSIDPVYNTHSVVLLQQQYTQSKVFAEYLLYFYGRTERENVFCKMTPCRKKSHMQIFFLPGRQKINVS